MRGARYAIDAALLAERARWRSAGQRLVLASGCFDLLHAGHLALLERARALGDVLLVAVAADATVRALKGAGRPLVPARERAELLLALEAVERVVIFEQETPLAAVRALVPDVLVKGADWGRDAVAVAGVVAAAGGRVARIGRLPRRSTTALVERIRRA